MIEILFIAVILGIIAATYCYCCMSEASFPFVAIFSIVTGVLTSSLVLISAFIFVTLRVVLQILPL
ncbi:hypothetical protein [Duganella sp. FT27W]|uniref:hypothetical protein n=1 Tax=Duganella sp. FT27W TaxID=2654636 RepID=UPI00128B74FF|nr:hypothetical protein [Duganella sp. FT27W]MPQ56287.1 hypothetical protein [Duganella sp. FT27W]